MRKLTFLLDSAAFDKNSLSILLSSFSLELRFRDDISLSKSSLLDRARGISSSEEPIFFAIGRVKMNSVPNLSFDLQ